MAGVGYAYVIAGWTTLLLNTAFLLIKSCNDWKDYKLFSLHGGFELATLKLLARRGIPTGIQYTTENIANLINSIFLGLHSLTALSADQMAMQLALTSSIANGGLAQAVQACVSNALGKKNFRRLCDTAIWVLHWEWLFQPWLLSFFCLHENNLFPCM